MALFPPDLAPASFDESIDPQALVVPGRGTARQVIRRTPSGLYTASLDFEVGTDAANEARVFYRSCGPSLSFYLFSPDAEALFEGVPVGTGDASTFAWAVPFTLPVSDHLETMVAYVGSTAYTYLTSWWLGVENRIVYSEDLSQVATWAAVGGASITRTSGQTDPLGGVTAWRIQSGGGASTTKLTQALAAPGTGRHVHADVWAKAVGTNVTISTGVGGSQLVTAGAGWTNVQLTQAASGAGAMSLDLVAPAVGDALDVYLWHPWIAWEDSPTYSGGNPGFGIPSRDWRYIPTGTAAVTADSDRRLRLSFLPSAPPAGAAVVTADLCGRRRRLVRFVTDAAAVRLDNAQGYAWRYQFREVAA